MSSCLTSHLGPLATSTQTPTSFSKSTTLENWSAAIGHPMIGTPWLRASSTEFHPQWLKNAEMDLWDKISTWGAHLWTSKPLFRSWIRCSNPWGNHSSALNSEFMSNPIGGLTTQMKYLPLTSNAVANCIIWDSEIVFWEPKHMYRTEFTGFESSHLVQGSVLGRHLFLFLALASRTIELCRMGPGNVLSLKAYRTQVRILGRPLWSWPIQAVMPPSGTVRWYDWPEQKIKTNDVQQLVWYRALFLHQHNFPWIGEPVQPAKQACRFFTWSTSIQFCQAPPLC